MTNVFIIGVINRNINEDCRQSDNYKCLMAMNGLIIGSTRIPSGTERSVDHVFCRVSNKNLIRVEVRILHLNISDQILVRVTVIAGHCRLQSTSSTSDDKESPVYGLDYVTFQITLTGHRFIIRRMLRYFSILLLNFLYVINKAKIKVIRNNSVKNIKLWINFCIKIRDRNKNFVNWKKHINNVELKKYYTRHKNKPHFEIKNRKKYTMKQHLKVVMELMK